MVHDSGFESRGAFNHSRSALQHASQNHQRNPQRFVTSRGAHKRKPPARVCNKISLILQHARNVCQLFMHMAFMQLFLHNSLILSPSGKYFTFSQQETQLQGSFKSGFLTTSPSKPVKALENDEFRFRWLCIYQLDMHPRLTRNNLGVTEDML